jgi:hypothetical protein
MPTKEAGEDDVAAAKHNGTVGVGCDIINIVNIIKYNTT